MKREARIIKVSGPLVVAEGMEKARMYDMVRVGKMSLIGEIIEIKEDKASVQVYEETSGLGPGEPVETTMAPLSVELGPGLMSGIYDGIQRPPDIIRDKTGSYITRGITLPAVNRRTSCGVGNQHPVTKHLGGQFDIGSLTATCAGAGEFKKRFQKLAALDG